MEGILAEFGGLNFVLKRPGGSKPEWMQSTGNKDFHVSFPKVVPKTLSPVVPFLPWL